MILFYRRNLPLWIYLKKIEYIPEKHRTEKTIAGSVDRHRTIIQVGSYKYGIWADPSRCKAGNPQNSSTFFPRQGT